MSPIKPNEIHPIFVYGETDEPCPICYNEYSYKLEECCGQSLCMACMIQIWFTNGKKFICPYCRYYSELLSGELEYWIWDDS